MKATSSFVLGLVLFVSLFAQAGDRYPKGPNPNITPGSLCQNSPVRRYPEGIVYCERDVDTQLKKEIIKQYDSDLGYEISHMNRMEFKIDHYIPLSIGGSNSRDNLWPQHRTVYDLTDPLEHLLSEKIKAAEITQAEAVRVIREAKTNLDRVPELIDYVNHLH